MRRENTNGLPFLPAIHRLSVVIPGRGEAASPEFIAPAECRGEWIPARIRVPRNDDGGWNYFWRNLPDSICVNFATGQL